MSPTRTRPAAARIPVFLVRHGVTEWNRDGLIQGWTDIPLSEVGRRQAQKLADRLRPAPVGRVITSNLSRAIETAEAAARAHGVAVESYPDLREYNCGDWEGRSYHDIRAKESAQFWAWFDNPEVPMPGGESMSQAADRAMPVVERVLAEMVSTGDSTRALVIIGHGGINRLIAGRLMGMSHDLAKRLRLDNASLSILEPFRDTYSIRLWNGTDHLNDVAGDAETPASRVG